MSNNNYFLPFPTRFRNLIGEKNISQQDLADVIGVKRQTIAQWKDGKTTPDIYFFQKLCVYFEVSYEYLLGESSCKQKENIDLSKQISLEEQAIILLKKWTLEKENSKDYFDKIDILSHILTQDNFEDILEKILFSINESSKYKAKKLLMQLNDTSKNETLSLNQLELQASLMDKRIVTENDYSDFYRFQATELFQRMLYDLPDIFHYKFGGVVESRISDYLNSKKE